MRNNIALKLSKMSEEEREQYLKDNAKSFNFEDFYKVAEKSKSTALYNKDTQLYSRLTTTKAHVEMFDPKFH